MTDTLRKTDFATLVATLREQQERKVDLVLPAANMCFSGGNLRIRRSDVPVLTEDGVTAPVEEFVPGEVFDDGLSSRLGIPRAYLRTMRDNGWTDMIDGNANALLHGRRSQPTGEWLRDPSSKRFLVRALKDADGGQMGTARALLSNSYKIVDHLETLSAALRGMERAGLGADNIVQADLTGRRMYITVVAPEIKALAPELLKGYRSPFSGATGADNPTVFAGFVLSNSETGYGAFTVTPRLVVEVCSNGMTVAKDAVSRTHLGARLDDGVIQYSDATRQANLNLITSQAQDAIRTFLDTDYMVKVISDMEAKAGATVKEPEKVIKEVTQKLEFSAMYDTVLEHFIKGGDTTRGGLMNAITSAAQTADDADLAFRMEERALRVLA
jgi:hypothetical protein